MTHDLLSYTNARTRLARYRAKAARSLETIRGCRTPEAAAAFIANGGYVTADGQPNWRKERYRAHLFGDAHGPTFSDDGGHANIPESVLDGLRDAGASHDIIGRLPRGYYADAHGDETYSGHVWRLPARDGSPLFIAGYTERERIGNSYVSPGGYAVLDATRGSITLFDDIEDAARAADGLAERAAERDRDYSERWQEASREDEKREDARNELRGARHDAHVVIAAWKEQSAIGTLAPSVCELLRERLQRARDDMRAAIANIHARTDAIAALDMDGEF